MENSKMLTILILALALMLCTVSTALGAVSLTVNGQDVTLIELEQGQSCTVEVVSDNSNPYMTYVGFDDRVVLGSFDQPLALPEAGDMASITEYDEPYFYGYFLRALGFSLPPSAGVHFTFEYVALQIGETDVKLYNDTFTSVIDSVNITVIPLQPIAMGSAFTYQGSLNDAGSPADGLYDFQFKLFDDPNTVTANQIGTTIDINDLDVIDGFFTVVLDFGTGVFTGDARWLEITVAQRDGSEPFTLTPPLELTPTPYAIYAQTAGADNDWMLSRDDMYSIPSGNVGIGTSAPDAKLDVVVASGPAATIGSSTNSAAGDYAVAMGSGTTASGDNSTAMGHYTDASGNSSTAMGRETTAGGDNSTAMGQGTAAGGYASTAMGRETTASGYNSTAMGREIEAAGMYSVAIALADMDGATVTRDNTMAILGGNVGIGTPNPAEKLEVDGTVKAAAFLGDGSGLMNLPIGYDSDWTIADSNMYSAVSGNVGIGTIAPGAKLDVEVASGPAATIGSSSNSAAGDYAVAMGDSTTAGGNYSTAMGSSTTASGNSSTAMGVYTTAGGDYSTAMGQGTAAGGDNSTAMGYNAIAGGSYSTAMGHYTDASGNSSTAMGYNTTASGYASTAMGVGTTAGRDYSTAMGVGTTASGWNSTAMGYNTTAGGPYSTAMGQGTTASGDNSTAMGRETTASVSCSTAMGSMTTAGGYASTAMGNLTTASGWNSTAMGCGIEAAGSYSVAIALSDQTDVAVIQSNTMAIMGGNVGIGTTTPGYTLHVEGDIAYTGSISDISDLRLKENITPLENGVEKLSCLKGIYFNNKGDSPDKREVGVIAQDVEKVLPELVSTDKQGYKSVDYTKLTPVLIEAVKELKAENDELQEQNNRLESRLSALENEMRNGSLIGKEL